MHIGPLERNKCCIEFTGVVTEVRFGSGTPTKSEIVGIYPTPGFALDTRLADVGSIFIF